MKGVEVTDDMLDAVSGMQLVESVTLLSGNAENGFMCAAGRRFLRCARASADSRARHQAHQHVRGRHRRDEGPA
jgi:hypothetical protein